MAANEDPQQQRLERCERRVEALLRMIDDLYAYIKSQEDQLRQIQGG